MQRLVLRSGHPAQEVESLLQEFEAAGLLSDERRAASLRRRRLEQGYGPARIAAEFRQLGLEPQPIDLVLQTDAARQALRRRFGASPPRDRTERLRRSQFLVRRGFPASLAQRLLESGDEDPES